jgi:hypothetical protein
MINFFPIEEQNKLLIGKFLVMVFSKYSFDGAANVGGNKQPQRIIKEIFLF